MIYLSYLLLSVTSILKISIKPFETGYVIRKIRADVGLLPSAMSRQVISLFLYLILSKKQIYRGVVEEFREAIHHAPEPL